MKDYFSGIRYFLQGFSLMLKPRIRRFTLIPVGINVLVFSVLIALGKSWYESGLQSILPGNDSWWASILYTLMWLLFSIAVALVGYFSFITLANLIGAPFNGFLAEALERRLDPASNLPQSSFRDLLRDSPGILLNELRKILYFLLWVIPAAVLFFIPAVNIAAPLIWFFLISWMLALQYFDFPMANHNLRFSDVRQKVRLRPWLGLGFGSAVSLAMMIPVLNLFIMPAAVCGATACWVREYQKSDL